MGGGVDVIDEVRDWVNDEEGEMGDILKDIRDNVFGVMGCVVG